MTADQFVHAMVDLGERASRVTGESAAALHDEIARMQGPSLAITEDRLAKLHWQLLLVELSHRVCRAESAPTWIAASGRNAASGDASFASGDTRRTPSLIRPSA